MALSSPVRLGPFAFCGRLAFVGLAVWACACSVVSAAGDAQTVPLISRVFRKTLKLKAT
jgi:hypothetical protein